MKTGAPYSSSFSFKHFLSITYHKVWIVPYKKKKSKLKYSTSDKKKYLLSKDKKQAFSGSQLQGIEIIKLYAWKDNSQMFELQPNLTLNNVPTLLKNKFFKNYCLPLETKEII